MMKILLKTVIVTVAISLCSCSHEEKSDLENCDLVGKVKSVTTVSYDAFDKFGEGNVQKAKPSYIIARIYSFDSIGNLLVEKSLSVSNIKRKYTTFTNNQKQQTKWLCYDDDDDSKMQYGHNCYYDEKGNLLKEANLHDNIVTNYKNTYDFEGHLISQLGGAFKKYWEYSNKELVKHTEYFYDTKHVFFYENGRIQKETYSDGSSPSFYRTRTYDEQGREIEAIAIENDNIIKKIKTIYSSPDAVAPMEKIIWDADGAIENDYTYSYFTVGKDTVTIFNFDKDVLERIEFYLKEPNGVTKDIYHSESSLLMGYQYIYENGDLVARRDLENGAEHKFIDGILTITEEKDDDVTEKKYKRNNLISHITKDKNGKIKYSYVVEGNNSKKTITIIDNGETKKGEEIYENGKLVKFTEATNGLTSTIFYDNNGHMTELKNSDGNVWTYKFEYDSHGNWVRKITYENGKPDIITERSIIYYN